MLKVLKALRMCGFFLTFQCRKTGRLTLADKKMKRAGNLIPARPMLPNAFLKEHGLVVFLYHYDFTFPLLDVLNQV